MISQDSSGEVLASLRNKSRGRMLVLTAPHHVEVRESGNWITPHYTGFVCGNVDLHQNWVSPGGTIRFPVYDRIELLKPGQTIRVSVRASSGFNEGLVISNELVFGSRKKS